MNLFVNNNGEVISANEYSIKSGSRAFLYGDGLFETIRIFNGIPINFENHFKRLIKGAEELKMKIPTYFTEAFLLEKLFELIQKSNITEGGKCRVSLERVAGGTYRPESNNTSYFIDIQPLTKNNFTLNAKGWEVDVYLDHKKTKSEFSNLKTKNGLIYVLASISAQEKGLDDLLISNTNNGIIEGSSSNLFVVSNGVLYTPSLEEGCVAGTMRMQIINLALENGIKVYECNVLPSNMLMADEIFLTNAVQGIIWVGGYKNKRYFNSIVRKLVALLNEKWIEQTRN